MNTKLIEDFRLQVRYSYEELGANVSYAFTPKMLERYTELVVKECAEVAIDCDVTKYNDFREGIAHRIKEHFGVE